MIRARRVVLVAAAVATSVLALTACGNQQAGSAATMGDTRITEQQLTTQVEDILRAKGQPVTSPDQALVQQTLGRMITVRLVDDLAAQQGVVITQGQLDEAIATFVSQSGDRQQFEQVFVQQNIAPAQIDTFVKLQLQAQALGIKLDPTGSAEEQGQAVFDAVSALSADLDTTVSPRYGTWDVERLALGPAPSDLSTLPTEG